MTTNRTTRKPAPKTTRRAPAPKAATETNGDYFNLATATIPQLIAKLSFLAEEGRYHKTIGVSATSPREKQAEIMKKLLATVPSGSDDVYALIDFIGTRFRQMGVGNRDTVWLHDFEGKSELELLKNVKAGISASQSSLMKIAAELTNNEVRKVLENRAEFL